MNATAPRWGAEPLAVVEGVRTPFAKAFGALADTPADELGRLAVAAVLERAGLKPDQVDEVVFGNVAGPPEASNVARVIALRAGVPADRIAHTVNRNCASGIESIVSAWHAIRDGRAEVVVAGGTESMSNVPLVWDRRMAALLVRASRARGLMQKLKVLSGIRPSYFKPIAALELGLTDPVCGLDMGCTAEVLAREFSIPRDEQDQFALESHQKAVAAQQRCFLKDEIAPVPAGKESVGRISNPSEKPAGQEAGEGRTDGLEIRPTGPSAAEGLLDKDNGPREKQSLEQLAKLKPIFERDGTVTAGNSCPVTDGAAALVLMPVERARQLDRPPLGYVKAYAIAGCDPRRMGLGPVFATNKLLHQTGLSLGDFDLYEINEAFAAQVLSCLKAMASEKFAQEELGRSQPLGDLDPEKLNVNGGAIALGHPVGTSGTRLVLTLLRALKERGLRRGLATLCVGGGQGAAVVVETEL